MFVNYLHVVAVNWVQYKTYEVPLHSIDVHLYRCQETGYCLSYNSVTCYCAEVLNWCWSGQGAAWNRKSGWEQNEMNWWPRTKKNSNVWGRGGTLLVPSLTSSVSSIAELMSSSVTSSLSLFCSTTASATSAFASTTSSPLPTCFVHAVFLSSSVFPKP